MPRIFTTPVQMQKALEYACARAVQTTCYRLLGTLQHLIMSEYYDQFDPDRYERTYQFYDSAMTKMLSKIMGEIYMDKDSMTYGNYWNGECQLQFASRGYHGNTEYYTEGKFWDTFIKFCNKNARKILKEELMNQKVPINQRT